MFFKQYLFNLNDKVKAQSSIEYLLLIAFVGVIVIVAVSYLYTVYQHTQNSFPTISEYISSFNINNQLSVNGTGCSFNFSFSSQADFSPLPLKLKINSPTGKFYFLSINSSDYSEINYDTASGKYYYKYSYINSSIFNDSICGLFNTYNNGKIGSISEVIASYKGKQYAFKLYSPKQTIYP